MDASAPAAPSGAGTPTCQDQARFLRAKEEVAAKVRKLLGQAEDRAATPEEAHAFTMKAQQLMTKYAIDLAMITDPARAQHLVERGWIVTNPYATHKVSLINAVARANDCRVIYADLRGGRKRIEVVGYAGDVEWTQTLAHSLELQMAAALAAAVRHKAAGVHGRTFSVAFVQGFTAEVNRRLHDARREAVTAAERSRDTNQASAARPGLDAAQPAGHGGGDQAAGSVALVLVAKKQRVEDEFKIRHPRTRTVARQVRLRSWSGYSPGRAAGSKATLARGAVGARRTLSA